MILKQGDQLPEATFVVMDQRSPAAKTTEDIFAGRNVAVFGLPGAYTPVCHKEHLPGIVGMHDTLTQHGIDVVACTAVNDAFVLDRWAEDLGAKDKVLMLADGNADFALKAGLAIDMTRYGLGVRSNRYAMLVADKKVTLICVEDAIMDHKVSSAASLSSQVGQCTVHSASG